MSDQEMLHIATIGKPHGIKGSLSILSKTQPGSLIFSTELFLKTTDGFMPFTVDGLATPPKAGCSESACCR